VIVFSADAGHGVPTERAENGVRIRRFQSVSHSGAFYFAPQMAIAVRRADVNVVHAHNYHAFPLSFAALGIADERFIMTTHYHGESASGFRNVLLSAYHPIGKWAVRQADDVIAVSEWEQKCLGEDFDIEPIVIPNGVDVEGFAGVEPKEWSRSYLLCVGRLEEYKGIQYVIRAMTELPEHDLLVVGNGPYRNELEQITRTVNVEDQVEFLGYVDEEELPRLYAGAEVYVTMSELEAYGMTVSEALAAGTPCVVRDTGALSNWTGAEGVLDVQKNSPKIISQAIISAVDTQTSSDVIVSWKSVVDRLLGEVYN
jgi:glycosyltransferase involved in cell wall biosynthesis